MSEAPTPIRQQAEQFQNPFFVQSSGSFVPPLESSCVFSSLSFALVLMCWQPLSASTPTSRASMALTNLSPRPIPHSSTKNLHDRFFRYLR
jgi:hypothetical protein